LSPAIVLFTRRAVCRGQQVLFTRSLQAVDFEDAEEMVDLEEKEIAAVVAPLSKRRARLFREAIAASGDRKNDNWRQPGPTVFRLFSDCGSPKCRRLVQA
jgi:hypothetical protein